jgi:hypothetical protein
MLVPTKRRLSRQEKKLARELSRALTSKNARKEEWALREFKRLGDWGDTLVERLVQDEIRFAKLQRSYPVFFILAILLALVTDTSSRNPLERLIHYVSIVGVLLANFFATAMGPSLRRENLIYVLCDRASIDTLGLLLPFSRHSGLPGEFYEKLTAILHEVRPEHAGQLSRENYAALQRLLKHDNGALVIAALSALEHVGRRGDLPSIEALLSPRIRDTAPTVIVTAAEQTAGAIRRRVEQERGTEHLLRPSEPSSALLVRPAEDKGENDAAQLLRADAPP